MIVTIEINHKIYKYNLSNINLMKRKLYKINNANDDDNIYLECYSDYLFYKIKEDTGLDSKFYKLKYRNIQIENGENLLKILDDSEDCKLDLEWNSIFTFEPILNLSVNNKIFKIPNFVVSDSKLISSLLNNQKDYKKSIVFNNEDIFNVNFINDWIKLSSIYKNFLKKEEKKEVNIPKPLSTSVIKNSVCGDSYIKLILGHDITYYLDSMDISRIVNLLNGFEYLNVENLLEIVCSYTANKAIETKSIDFIKKLILG